MYVSLLPVCLCTGTGMDLKRERTGRTRHMVVLPQYSDTGRTAPFTGTASGDTKYWLWVNGELQVSEGGLKRGPNPSDTYCDVITSLPALRAGENTVALLVWYFGKDGFSHRNSPTAGISFSLSCDGKEVEPDAKWRVK